PGRKHERRDQQKNPGDLSHHACAPMAVGRTSEVRLLNRLAGEAGRGAEVPQKPGSSRDSLQLSSIFKAAMKASWGISTLPNWRIFFMPSFCLSKSLRLRLMSPP